MKSHKNLYLALTIMSIGLLYNKIDAFSRTQPKVSTQQQPKESMYSRMKISLKQKVENFSQAWKAKFSSFTRSNPAKKAPLSGAQSSPQLVVPGQKQAALTQRTSGVSFTNNEQVATKQPVTRSQSSPQLTTSGQPSQQTQGLQIGDNNQTTTPAQQSATTGGGINLPKKSSEARLNDTQTAPAVKKEPMTNKTSKQDMEDDAVTIKLKNDAKVIEAENNLKTAIIEKKAAQDVIQKTEKNISHNKYGNKNYENTDQLTISKATIEKETTKIKNLESRLQSGQELLQQARNKRVADYMAHEPDIVNMVHSPENTIQIGKELHTAKAVEKQHRDTYAAESRKTRFFETEPSLSYNIEKSAKAVDLLKAKFNQVKALEAREHARIVTNNNAALGHNN